MNKKIPLLSIGLPVYNSSEYIHKVLNSLINQSLRDFELIISDDASKDDTTSICKSYLTKDERIRLITQESNIGMVNNQNFVLNQAKGKYFMWAAHDDYYHEDFIQTLISALEENDKLVTAFCPFSVFANTPKDIISTYNLNYEGKSVFWRVLSFCLNFNDACFYGIHRREIIAGTKVPTWWGKNSITPANSNYPVVFYLLASGQYRLVGNKPLFFKKSKEASYSLNPYNSGLNPYLFLILRKINLFADSVSYIYLGSHSYLISMTLTLPVFIRISKDAMIDVYYRLKCSILSRKL